MEAESDCDHVDLWRARDGVWRCESCDPPVFAAEVLERRELQAVLTLFDDEQRALGIAV